MNIRLPENRRAMSSDNTIYKMGHRDARHAAAHLAARHEEAQYALMEALEAFVNYNAEAEGDVSMGDNEQLWERAEYALNLAYGETQ